MSGQYTDISPTMGDKTGMTKNTKKVRKSKKKNAVFPGLIMLFLVIVFIECCMTYYNSHLDSLYVGVRVLGLIVLYYVVAGVLYFVGRREVKKQIAFMSEVSDEQVQELFDGNRYKRWFKGANYGLFLPLTIVLCATAIGYDLSAVGSVSGYVCNYVGDYFTEPDTAVVTYVNETEIIAFHTTKDGTPYYYAYTFPYRLVNFRTSDGEFLTLYVSSSYHLEKVRTFENTQISYRKTNNMYAP